MVGQPCPWLLTGGNNVQSETWQEPSPAEPRAPTRAQGQVEGQVLEEEEN